jgi:hypothetical protein
MFNLPWSSRTYLSTKTTSTVTFEAVGTLARIVSRSTFQHLIADRTISMWAGAARAIL